MNKVEIRVTRPSFYPPDCQNPAHQQGYYFRGTDMKDAVANARSKFPHEPLTYQLWKQWRDGSWQVARDAPIFKITMPA